MTVASYGWWGMRAIAKVEMATAIALTNNLTLVTHNIREFERVERLLVED